MECCPSPQGFSPNLRTGGAKSLHGLRSQQKYIKMLVI